MIDIAFICFVIAMALILALIVECIIDDIHEKEEKIMNYEILYSGSNYVELKDKILHFFEQDKDKVVTLEKCSDSVASVTIENKKTSKIEYADYILIGDVVRLRFNEAKKTNEMVIERSFGISSETTPDQIAKSDKGKPRLSLVPRKIIFDIAKIREYGNAKYPEGGPDNWKGVSKERYRDAAFRHFMAYLDDPTGLDEESGLPHLSHLACNVAFLCELEDL